MTYQPDPRIVVAAEHAEIRLRSRLDEVFGEDSPPLVWLDERFGGNPLADVFLRPGAHPILSLPWWAVGSHLSGQSHAELAYSSMCGYLFIRIIDDVADGDQAVPAPILPALGFFHTEFTGVFRRWFPVDHPFWENFAEWWLGTAAAAVADLSEGPTDQSGFELAAARKTNAAIIPVAAALHRVERSDEIEAWRRWVVAFGRWHQFHNDIEGIERDTRSGAGTWVIAEARKQAPGMSPRGWLWTSGLEWAAARLDAFADDVMAAALDLNCPAPVAYLQQRFDEWRRVVDEVRRHLDAIASAALQDEE